MKILLFTKRNPEYQVFLNTCTSNSKEIMIIYDDSHPRKRNADYQAFLNKCRTFDPDLILSFYYGKIIQKEIIDLSRLYSVNFHGSLLPDYSGSHSLQWQIINGEKKSGVTVHKLSSKVDAGDILYQQKFEILFSDTANETLRKGINVACDLAAKLFRDLNSSVRLRFKKQVITGKEFLCKKRTPLDGEIKDDMAPEDIVNLTRALVAPWPPAFYYDRCCKKIIVDSIINEESAKIILDEINEKQ